jgi:hypothetical protein
MPVEFELTNQVLEGPKTARVVVYAVIVIVQAGLFLKNVFVIIIILIIIITVLFLWVIYCTVLAMQ